jgi:serine/threonine protein kinase
MNINDTVTLKKDRYTLIEKQVGGAQAEVFKVRRESDKRILALKIARIWKDTDMLWPISRVKSNCSRIQQEIEFLQSLKQAEEHYIVACLDTGTLKEGGRDVPAFVMPYYQYSLSKRLFEQQQPNLSQYLVWIKQMIIALKYIHHQTKEGEALMHRDMKLDNLMLSDQNEIRLLDFGISKNVFKRADSTHTQMNYSDDCVAPEQILLVKPNTDGKKHVAIGTHTDIYALGLLIYRIIAGYLPESQENFIVDLERISYQHKIALDKGEAGLLGKVGGITAEETEFLAQTFIDLAENRAVTFVYEDELEEESISTSIYKEVAEQFSEFVAELLDKRYQDRPNAKNSLHWIENVQFKLSKLEAEIVAKSIIQSDLETHSSESSFKPKQTPSKNKSKPVTPVKSNATTQLVSNPKTVNQAAPNAPITSSPTPRKVKSGSITQPRSNLESSQTTSTADTKPNPREERQTSALPVKKILLAVIIVLALVIIAVQYSKRDTSQDNANDQVAQLNNNPNADMQVLEAEMLGDDPLQWEAAFMSLNAPENSKNPQALALLAHAYEKGKTVSTHWGKAWLYYQKALQYGDDKKIARKKHNLEVKANTILANTQSSKTQRKKAYQVIETVAGRKIIPLSINARLWMEYRYRMGDGVKIDIIRANEWKRKYNQIKDEAP